MQGGTSHGSERNKGDGRAYAVRADEGDWARRGIEASCAFIMAAAGRYGCSPFAAAACAAMWLGSDTPGYAMAAAILGAAYAKAQ